MSNRKKCPWKDFAGNDIHEGDTIIHPSGESGVVCYWPNEMDAGDQWRVFYAEYGGNHSRLCLQIGDKGMAVVKALAPTSWGQSQINSHEHKEWQDSRNTEARNRLDMCK